MLACLLEEIRTLLVLGGMGAQDMPMGSLSLNMLSILHARDHSRFFTVPFHRCERGEMGSHRSHMGDEESVQVLTWFDVQDIAEAL